MKILAAILLVSSVAAAEGMHVPLATVPLDPAHASDVGRVLYLNRCVGGCTISVAGDDASAHTSTIPMIDPANIAEWEKGDAAWQQLVQCVKEVYSPYGVTITDVKPTDGSLYNEAIVAGRPSQIGWSGIGGVAPASCDPYNNVISFSFSQIYGDVIDLCATVAQETGHAYGLEHEYEFVDGRSACTDPMTYRTDCGGQRFFRNDAAYCGEYTKRSCNCGGTQNSHLQLLDALGTGTPITAKPTVNYVSPVANSMVKAGDRVIVTASAQRGIRRVELWINGYKWNEVTGVPFGQGGQPAASYQIPIPDGVPDSLLDLKVIAKDDIDAAAETTTVQVIKGAACATADTCLAGQRCDAGRCLWDPAVGEFGDACTYEQYCKSGICGGVEGSKICTSKCVPGNTDSCAEGYVCEQFGPGDALCLTGAADDPGCCSTGNGAAVQSTALGLALITLLRRRRR